jgi:ribonuclease R
MREKILAFFKSESTKKITVEELREVLHVSSSEEIVSLMKTVNQLVEEAVLIESSKHELTLIENTNFVVGRLIVKPRGFGFLVPNDPSKNDVYIGKNDINEALNNDIVLVHIEKFGYGVRQEGIVRKVIERKYTHIIGTMMFRNSMGFVISDDKSISTDIVVKTDHLNGAKKYDKVRCKILNYSFRGKIECAVTEVLGNKNDSGVDVLSKILKHNVDPLFNDEVLEEANKFGDVTKADYEGRKDLTKEIIITIDGDDAKDFDDAVNVKTLPNGNYKLSVSIADVSHYVTEGSILDVEAFKRGTSIYMPGRVIPMLPENLSNGVCSLRPDEERLTQTCDMEIDLTGKVVNYEIYPSVIKSYKRMTYNQINKIFMGDVELSEKYVDLVGMFYKMRNLAKILKKKRESFGSINFETDESYITLDENGKAIDIQLRERGISESIIEEFMLKANQVVAEHVFWLNLPFIYRVHDKPTEEKLNRLLKMADALGFKVKAKNEISNFELQKLVNQVHGTESEKGVNLLMLRSMQKAIYSEFNLGHYGLSFKYYTHFTSPIRRYPDLIVHRLLREYLFKGNKSTAIIDYYTEHMKGIAAQTSETERRAVILEREVVDMKKAEYISQYINKRFDGIISSVTSFGLYVSLPNTIEGLVHITQLNDDYYVYDENLMLLVGERRKKVYRVGDKVTIQVVKANINDGEVDFKIVKGL